MECQRKYVVVMLMVALTSYIYAEQIIDVELENIEIDRPWTGARAVYRQNASGGGSLHLYENDAIIIRLCPNVPMFVSVENVSYSNDGMSDTVQLLENQYFLGTFSTYQHSNWGEYWNDFLPSGPLGKFETHAEPINLTLSVPYADCFGVELDKIVLKVNKSVNQTFFICGYELVEGPKKSECMPTEFKDTDVIHKSSYMQTTTITSGNVETMHGSSITNTMTVERQSPTTVARPKVATESISTVKPIVTTKQGYLVSSTAVSSPDRQKNEISDVMVKQKSSRSNCLDRKNINVEFSVPNIVGTMIISSAENVFDTNIDDNSLLGNAANTCDNAIWRLGNPDNNSREFSSTIPNSDVEFTIVEGIAEAKKFPGVIQTDKTHKIVIRYTLGYNKQLESGSSALFTLGLASLTKDIDVGVQYYHRGKKDTKIYTNTLSPKLPVIGWVIPAGTISPSLENQIHIFFHNASYVPIEIDFMRLDYTQNSTRSRNIPLHEDHLYRIRGAQYIKKSKVNYTSNEGMDVIIGKKTTSNVEKIAILYRYSTRGKYYVILTINENGEFFPYRETQEGDAKPRRGQELVDVSGLIFAGVDGTGKRTANPIRSLEINQSNKGINVTYEDGSTIGLRLASTPTDTRIVVNEARFPRSVKSSVTFVSTYMSDYVAAVNQINVDGLQNVHILSEEINNIKGSIFKFQKTSSIPLYKTGQVMEIRFCIPCFQ